MPAARPRLYAHPFSSYSQKALIALYENQTPFDYRNLEETPSGRLRAINRRPRRGLSMIPGTSSETFQRSPDDLPEIVE